MEKDKKKDRKNFSVLDYLSGVYRVSKVHTLLILFCYIWSGFYPSILVIITTRLLDHGMEIVKSNQNFEQLFLLLIPYIIVMIFNYGMMNIKKYAIKSQEISLHTTINLQVVTKKASVQYQLIEKTEIQDLFQRITENPAKNFQEGFMNILDLFTYVIQALSIFCIVFLKTPITACLFFLIAIPILYVAVKCGQYDYDVYGETGKHMRNIRYEQSMMTGRDQAEERELFSYTDKMNRMWNLEYQKVTQLISRATIIIMAKIKVANILAILVQVILILLLLPAIKTNTITVGIFISLVKAENDMVQKITWQLAGEIREFRKKQMFMKDYNALMHLEEDVNCLTAKEQNVCKSSLHTIEFQHVSFQYPGQDNYVIRDLSFELKSGYKYALVGSNGGGKTTIIKLLVGMYDDYEGKILINGVERRELDYQTLKSYFSILFQDFARYQISIRENVTLGNKDSNDKRINRIIEDAELAPFIHRLENGYDTQLGKLEENGVDLSGGEWQKIAIARCLFSDSPILILDEPTAALDPLSEVSFNNVMNKIPEDKLAIIITHRLSTVQYTDEAMVLRNGRICEQGSHQSLLEQQSVYREMYETQRSWYSGHNR
ncbi:ABC transporter ATP-binding protein [Anaerosporobacter faecicola]|uniref:ABC transporter ATP-binding protein n=1 Tax=Anaerosporobacter faecicola TaxID=2718714 RepID=UPI0014397477|nr:ABC transporter ATP-binding protein [Anaerosporobacter faecicola]